MKNEERIIELLAEYLQKTDRILDRLDSHDHLFEETLKRIDLNTKQTQELQNQTRELQNQTRELQNQTKELQKETKELRSESLKHEIKNDVLLKEILSISKRVMTLEEKTNLFG
jgi:peptidoglycan hydrolase CwlO-like protein